ncbi:hypothetical protein ACWDE9_32535 [Streptomyces olivaceoviridis]
MADSTGGYVRLINHNSAKAVEVAGASTSDGARRPVHRHRRNRPPTAAGGCADGRSPTNRPPPRTGRCRPGYLGHGYGATAPSVRSASVASRSSAWMAGARPGSGHRGSPASHTEK